MPFPYEAFSYNWVTPRLAIGSNPNTAEDAATLRSLGVTDGIDVRAESDATDIFAGSGVRYHHSARMIDDGRRQPASDYVQIVTDARSVLANAGTKLFVFCHAGHDRSASAVYAILRAAGLSPTEAWGRVKTARPVTSRQYVPSAEAAVASFPSGAIDLVGSPPSSTVRTAAKVALLGAGVATVIYGIRANPTQNLIPWWSA